METVTLPKWAYDKLLHDLAYIAEMDKSGEYTGEFRYSQMAGASRGVAKSLLSNLPLAVSLVKAFKEAA